MTRKTTDPEPDLLERAQIQNLRDALAKAEAAARTISRARAKALAAFDPDQAPQQERDGRSH